MFDASPAAARALEAAAELADRLGVPLLAVRVDEPERTRSEALAFVREVGGFSGSIRPFDPDPRSEAGGAPFRRQVERSSRIAIGALEVDVDLPLPPFMKKRAARTILEQGLEGLRTRAESLA